MQRLWDPRGTGGLAEMTRVLMLLANPFLHDSRVASEAPSLQRAGYEVTVLAWDRQGTAPPEEVREGVRIVRLRNTFGMRLRRYDFFRLRPFWRLAFRRALELHAATPFSIVHAHDLDTLPAGVRFKEATGARLVYDAHEIFPYLLELTPARRWAPRFAAMERRLVPAADLVIAAGPAHQEYLAPMTRAPVVLVTNSKALVDDAYRPPANKRMTVAYLGGLDPTRLLIPLAELAVEDPGFDVEIGGLGPLAPVLRDLAAKSSGNLRFLGLLPMTEVLPRTRASDVVFSVFNPAYRLNQIGVPNKFFEALVCGRPVLVSQGMRIASEVESSRCGLAIAYTKDALRAALSLLQGNPALREEMGRNALRLAKDRYNWAREEERLLAAYRGLVVPTHAPTGGLV